jgi:hypothetical protein
MPVYAAPRVDTLVTGVSHTFDSEKRARAVLDIALS